MLLRATTGYFASAGFVLLVFFVFLKLRGVATDRAFWLPIGGLVRAAIAGALVTVPVTIARPSYLAAFESVAPWLNLLVVPIYVWRRVPTALLPRVRLSELVLWNVTAVAISFGVRVGAKPDPGFGTVLFWSLFYSLWLWPSGLAWVVKKWNRDSLSPILKLPLVAYYWLSLLYWLLLSLWEREPAGYGLLGLADAVFQAFAAIQSFAIVYFVYFVSNAEVEALDIETGERVGSAVFDAIEVDEWPTFSLAAAAATCGMAVAAFSWANTATTWGVPAYGLLLLPYVISEVVAELRGPTPPLHPARMRGPQPPSRSSSARRSA